MRSLTIFVVLVLALVGGIAGYRFIHKDDNRLRMDDLHWRCPSVGEIKDGGNLKPDQELVILFSLRGCTSDSNGLCKTRVSSVVSGPGTGVKVEVASPRGKGSRMPLAEKEPFSFRKNSAITSLDFNSVVSGFTPGEYECTFAAEDLVAKSVVRTTLKFTVGSGFPFAAKAAMDSIEGGQLKACQQNCKNVATALEMYASDNSGLYPKNLSMLLPSGNHSYLKSLPTCPSTGQMTFLDYQCTTKPDRFAFGCCGNNHAKAYTGGNPEGFPKYDSDEGLK